MNKIKSSNPKLGLISNIGNPHNFTSKHTLAIEDSGANIHLDKQYTTTMDPVIISNDMATRLPYGSTMESSHIAKL